MDWHSSMQTWSWNRTWAVTDDISQVTTPLQTETQCEKGLHFTYTWNNLHFSMEASLFTLKCSVCLIVFPVTVCTACQRCVLKFGFLCCYESSYQDDSFQNNCKISVINLRLAAPLQQLPGNKCWTLLLCCFPWHFAALCDPGLHFSFSQINWSKNKCQLPAE